MLDAQSLSKRWECGWFPSYKKLIFKITFEHQPVWLLSLEQMFVEQICLPQFKSISDLLTFLSNNSPMSNLYSHILMTFHNQQLLTFKDVDCEVHLVSGKLDFLKESIALGAPHPMKLFVHEGYYRVRSKKDFGNIQFKQISHFKCGGGTTFSTIAYSSTPDFVIPPTQFKRQLGFFINHSHKTLRSNTPEKSCLKSTDLLNLKNYTQPVWLPTYWTASNFGARSLKPDELSHIVGFKSSWTSIMEIHDIPAIVPVQILDLLLRSFISTTAENSTRTILPSTVQFNPFKPTVYTPNPRGVYIKSLQRYLPHSWSQIETSIQTFAVAKNDDAKEDISLWNNRISLLFTAATSIRLQLVRDWLLRCFKRRFTKECFATLTDISRGSGGGVSFSQIG